MGAHHMDLLDPFNDTDEAPEIRQQAGRQGWSIDSDGWFRRLRRQADPPIGSLGFMTDDEVYVGSCGLALKYDDLAKSK